MSILTDQVPIEAPNPFIATDIITNPEPRCPCLLLLDTSGSMHGAPIRELNGGLVTFRDELVADDYFAHVSPSGVTPVDRIRAAGYIPGPEFGYVIGENLAWGTLSLSTPQAIVEAWMASPEHRANILEARYADTGIALAPAVPSSLSGGEPGATYGQEFGAIIA